MPRMIKIYQFILKCHDIKDCKTGSKRCMVARSATPFQKDQLFANWKNGLVNLQNLFHPATELWSSLGWNGLQESLSSSPSFMGSNMHYIQVTQVSIQSSQFIQNAFSFSFHFMILKIPPLSPEYFFVLKGRLIFLNIQLSPKETQTLLAIEKVKRKPWNKQKLN